jgi:Uma2 family endonuclease
MSQLSGTVEFGTAVKLNVQRTRLTKEQLALLCQENRDLRFELTAQQELIIMPPQDQRRAGVIASSTFA